MLETRRCLKSTFLRVNGCFSGGPALVVFAQYIPDVIVAGVDEAEQSIASVDRSRLRCFAPLAGLRPHIRNLLLQVLYFPLMLNLNPVLGKTTSRTGRISGPINARAQK